jgi:hypothetical protein
VQLAYTVSVVTGTKGARVPVFGQTPQPVREGDKVRVVRYYVFFSNLRVPGYEELVPSTHPRRTARLCRKCVSVYGSHTSDIKGGSRADLMGKSRDVDSKVHCMDYVGRCVLGWSSRRWFWMLAAIEDRRYCYYYVE